MNPMSERLGCTSHSFRSRSIHRVKSFNFSLETPFSIVRKAFSCGRMLERRWRTNVPCRIVISSLSQRNVDLPFVCHCAPQEHSRIFLLRLFFGSRPLETLSVSSRTPRRVARLWPRAWSCAELSRLKSYVYSFRLRIVPPKTILAHKEMKGMIDTVAGGLWTIRVAMIGIVEI